MEYIKDNELIQKLIDTGELDSIFSNLPAYLPYISIFRAGKRQQIFADAPERQEIYILLSGRVKVNAILNNGRQLLLDYYEPQELFGEHILSEVPTSETNYFYTETLTPVEGIALRVTPIRQLLMDDVKFLRFYIRCLQSRFIQLGSAQPMNVLNSSKRNVAGYIWSKLYPEMLQGKKKFYFNENLREVAELLGVSYRQLHRVLHSLVEEGILTRTEKGYLVSDTAGLQQIVEHT